MAPVGRDRVEGEPVSREAVLVVEEEPRIAEHEIGAARSEHLVRVVPGEGANGLVEDERAVGSLQAVREDELPLRLHRARAIEEDVEVRRQTRAGHRHVVRVAQEREEIGVPDRSSQVVERRRRRQVRRHHDRVALVRRADDLAELARVLRLARHARGPDASSRSSTYDTGSIARPRASCETPSSSTALPKQSTGCEKRTTQRGVEPEELVQERRDPRHLRRLVVLDDVAGLSFFGEEVVDEGLGLERKR